MRKLFVFLLMFFLLLVGVYWLIVNPNSKTAAVHGQQYLNQNDSVHEVGITTCRQCHNDIYTTFIQTGMGQSFAIATKAKSAAHFEAGTAIYDSATNFYYHPYWQADSLCVKEFRMQQHDTIYQRTEKVNYIIGSGQHTNSHLYFSGPYLYQVPMTFYTQKQQWDMPPGFEKGANTRFSRKIGLECQSCHNAYPHFQPGAENTYTALPEGINCERCHGSGSAHVALKRKGITVDTSNGKIDYSIVNPAKLPLDLQFDVCQRCHLQGNAVLKPGKSFLDFKPGMHLSDVMTVFLPKYKDAEDQFIMASHADRLKMSKCFKAGLTCVKCHNPHVSVRQTNDEVFNAKCQGCHQDKCTAPKADRLLQHDTCTSCHMPKSGAIDIPHVRITDHWIQRPKVHAVPHKAQLSTDEVSKIKRFMGLFAINETNPNALTKATAYLNQYEKFEGDHRYLLDSAFAYLRQVGKPQVLNQTIEVSEVLSAWLRWFFLQARYTEMLDWLKAYKPTEVLAQLGHTSLSNTDAWSLYHIAEAFSQGGNAAWADRFLQQALQLCPNNLEFLNKHGVMKVALADLDGAANAFQGCIAKDPRYAAGHCNLGYVMLLRKQYKEAEAELKKALALDPDYEKALSDLAMLYQQEHELQKAKTLVHDYLKSHPNATELKTRMSNGSL